MRLRSCQILALDACKKNKIGIVRMCCGSGKTVVEIELCLQEQISCLIAPRNALLKQHIESFKTRIGYIDSDTFDYSFETDLVKIVTINNESDFDGIELPTNKKLCIIINNSSLVKLPVKPDIVVVDEAHTHKESVAKHSYIKNAPRKYFFTATPQDMDNVKLYGETIYRYDYNLAVECGYVRPFKIIPIWNNKNANESIKEHMNKLGLTHCIHFYRTVNATKPNLRDVDKKSLPNCQTITASTSSDNRQTVLNNFKARGGHLLSCQTISYGIDIPECDSVFLSYVGNSIPDLVQKIMRAIRVNVMKPDKIAYVFVSLDIEEQGEGDITEEIKSLQQQLVFKMCTMIQNGIDIDLLKLYHPYKQHVVEQLEHEQIQLKKLLNETQNHVQNENSEAQGESETNGVEKEFIETLNDAIENNDAVINDIHKVQMEQEIKQQEPKSQYDDFFEDFDMKLWYKNGEIQSTITSKRTTLTTDQAFEELLEMKKAGKQVNNKSKERLSNGAIAGSWLGNNRKKLTEDQLLQLGLHDTSLTIDQVFEELLKMKNKGKKVNHGSRERLSNGVLVGSWLGDNKKKLTEDQLLQLGFDKSLTIDQVFEELLKMKNEGRKVNTQSKERLSNGTLAGRWFHRNKKELTEDQLRQLQEKPTPTSSSARHKTKLQMMGFTNVHNKCDVSVEETYEISQPEQTVNENLQEMTKDELMAMIRANEAEINRLKNQQKSQYNAPNPADKNKINELIASNINSSTKGGVIVLDDIDFKSATEISKTINTKDIIIPNNSENVKEMMKNTKFGECVKNQSLEDLLDECIKKRTPIKAIYADLMGSLTKEMRVMERITQCNLTKDCIIGFTICARDQVGAEYTNDYATKLVDTMWTKFTNFKPANLVPNSGVYVYGTNMRMATSVFKLQAGT